MSSWWCASGKGATERRDFDRLEEKYNLDVDDLCIIATSLQKGATKLRKLQEAIQRKQTKVNTGGTSRYLKATQETYSITLNDLHKYALELKPILDNTKDRTVLPDRPFRKTYSLNEKHKFVNRDKKELEIERDSISRKNTRLTDENLRNIESKEEHYPVRNQQENETENSLKKEKEILLKKLEESENEKAAIKISHKEEIGKLMNDLRVLKERLTDNKSSDEKREKELKAKCAELHADITSMQKEIEEKEREIEKWKNLHSRLTDDKSSYEKREKELKMKCAELQAEITSFKENWTKSEDAKVMLEIRIKDLEQEKKGTKEKLQSQEEEMKRTEEKLERSEAKINMLTNKVDNEKKAKEDALIRLSSMASNKLRDNNPNIADLSDPHRPTKLSEQYSELYDNEWTDAFDELENLLSGKEDKEIISYLRDIVIEIHSECSKISSSKMKTIEEEFVKPSVPSENTKIPPEIFKTIKDGIKSMAPKLLEGTKEYVLRHLEEKYLKDPVAGCLQHENVKHYIDKCTEVCWYMSVQDPQLVMDGSNSPDRKFDSNKHREYTKKGPYEEFVVWPALYLYHGGQMLSKGVAQGTKETEEQ